MLLQISVSVDLSLSEQSLTQQRMAAQRSCALQVAVGREEWVAERTGSGQFSSSSGGATAVCVGVKGRGIIGDLAFSDTLRPDAADVVRRLKAMGLQVMLLSGDRNAEVARMAQQVTIPQCVLALRAKCFLCFTPYCTRSASHEVEGSVLEVLGVQRLRVVGQAETKMRIFHQRGVP